MIGNAMKNDEKLCLGKIENVDIDYSALADDYFKEREEQKSLYGEELYEMIEQFWDMALKLRKKGLNYEEIRHLVDYSSPIIPTLDISEDYKIFVNVQDGKHEIKLDPLTKALYFIYLRHPEGLSRKMLESKKEEFVDLYKRITGWDELPPSKQAAIANLIDSGTNSFSVSTNRVKREFLKYMEEDLANLLCINGTQGDVKNIGLDRILVNMN